jgi:voltage-gated potassium channel
MVVALMNGKRTRGDGSRQFRRGAAMSGEPASESDVRLAAYSRRTGWLLLVLGFGFLVVYAIPILWPRASGGLLVTCEAASYVIWLAFVADFVTRVWLAERRWSYIGRHPVDLLAIALPALRPLRILRVFTAGQVILMRGKDFAIGRTLAAAAGAGALVTFIAALAVLDAERGHAGAKIETFREAIWWAGVTITTVGYGDYYPVTPVGQAVAFALMVVGISLLGLVTASVAAWFLTKVQAPAEREEVAVMAELRELRKQVAELLQVAADGSFTRQGDYGPGEPGRTARPGQR